MALLTLSTQHNIRHNDNQHMAEDIHNFYPHIMILSTVTLSTVTLSTMTLSIVTLSTVTLSIMTLRIMTLSKKTLRIAPNSA